jgi:flagellar basal-body rod protein FlgF
VTSEIYTAYSGLRTQLNALDMIADNLANLNTPGFKEEKAFYSLLNQAIASTGNLDELNSVISRQLVSIGGSLNVSDGSLSLTNRDLDVALTGDGFLAVQTPAGVRYTRNGSLKLNPKTFALATSEGHTIIGVNERPITLGQGKVSISENGDVYLNNERRGRMKVVTFEKPSMLEKEGNSLLAAKADQTPKISTDTKIRAGYLEESNVNSVSSVIQLVGVMRQFEAIQKCVDVVMNDLNSKSIEWLGR